MPAGRAFLPRIPSSSSACTARIGRPEIGNFSIRRRPACFTLPAGGKTPDHRQTRGRNRRSRGLPREARVATAARGRFSRASRDTSPGGPPSPAGQGQGQGVEHWNWTAVRHRANGGRSAATMAGERHRAAGVRAGATTSPRPVLRGDRFLLPPRRGRHVELADHRGLSRPLIYCLRSGGTTSRLT